ncbi:hypothetical protein [Vibrio hippocampi]|uniref:SH3 domain-containing protein n=1 Tax=Vibrio hippocampi TaxID=654686 RepID=A0ABN8DPM5_9VIBR|nr:hypothetical protein [Vibrio hippocampi]CAH0530187.1 hypothetical protein VHP8226_03888 [Vibrio hippocampi]
MKKLVIVLGVICLLLGGAGAAYYFGVFDKGSSDSDVMTEPPESSLESEIAPATNSQVTESKIELPVVPKVDAYYVNQTTTSIKIRPDDQAPEEGIAYYGEKLTPQEIQGDWIRIAPIYQLEPGSEEISQWVKVSDLSVAQVPLEGDKWAEVLEQYLNQSDDYLLYSDEFLKVSTQLLKQGECRLADFEQVGGWIKSINHPQDVYFTYCGGIDARHKKYFNVATQKIF